MIYTLTLNPAIDQMVSVKNFQLGVTNKVSTQYQVLGGKGINVSVMLKHLGYENIALGFMTKNNANQFHEYLASENINSVFHLVNGQVRTNIKIKSLNNSQETELNCLGFSVNKDDETAIFEIIKDKLKTNDVLVLAGSIPSGCDLNIYHDIAKYCYEHQIIFAIDTTKEAIIPTLQFAPLVIKPNLDELNEMFNANVSFDNIKELINLVNELQNLGAQNVLVSNGKLGSLLVTKDKKAYLANTAKGELINSVGAGDSMLAGFIGTYINTKDYEQSLVMASCAGASTAFSEGIGTIDLINSLKSQIIIKDLSI